MKTYFNDIDTLHRYTLELDRYRDELQCHLCDKNDQFVSHGYVYRPLSSKVKIIVGKRIFCANRHGRTGCGATHRLYLAEYIPSLRYTTKPLFSFLSSLIALCTIKQAYQASTGAESPRNAYRWLRKLSNKLVEFRSGLRLHAAHLADRFKAQTHRLRLLLPTLQTLFLNLPTHPCATYQQHTQIAFI